MKNKKAFTVIELLIVITIMAILISIIVVNFNKLQSEARHAKASANLRVVKVAIEGYAAKNGKFPAVLTDVLTAVRAINELPMDEYDPSVTFKYMVSPDGKFYAVWSVGENKTSTDTVGWTDSTPVPADADDIGMTNGTPPNTNWR